jgi:transcriptional regulator with XRE-family HTH domain
MDAMGQNTSLGEFLRVRRARLKPEDAGLTWHGARRVPGLRREELARLAGVSPTYYTRLEQGQSTCASQSVLDALARALGLSEDERTHLHNLARPAPSKPRRPELPAAARCGTLQLIEALNDVPAVVLGIRGEVLAWNRLGHLLLAGHLEYDAPGRPVGRPNLTRMLFLDPHHRALYSRWPEEAARAVSSLRLVAGLRKDDLGLAELIGELSIKSPPFASLWSKHPVANCVRGTKYFQHPEVGELALEFEMFQMTDGTGHRMLMYSAAAGAPASAGLQLLRAQVAAEDPNPASHRPVLPGRPDHAGGGIGLR